MFLKVYYNKKMKKIKFRIEYRKYQTFIDFIHILLKIKKEEEIKIHFFDEDEDNLVYIEDLHDYAYFLSEMESKTYFKIFVEKDIKIDKSNLNKEIPENIDNEIPEIKKKNNINNKKSKREKKLKELFQSLSKTKKEYDLKLNLIKKFILNPNSEQIQIEEEIKQKFESEKNIITDNISTTCNNNITIKSVIKIETPKNKLQKEEHKIKKKIIYIKSCNNCKTLENKIIEIQKEKKQTRQIINKIKTVHNSVTCDNCNIFPIIGKRFKSLKYLNYDLCENCENKNEHHHPMIRILKKADNKDFEILCENYNDLSKTGIKVKKLVKKLGNIECKDNKLRKLAKALNNLMEGIPLKLIKKDFPIIKNLFEFFDVEEEKTKNEKINKNEEGIKNEEIEEIEEIKEINNLSKNGVMEREIEIEEKLKAIEFVYGMVYDQDRIKVRKEFVKNNYYLDTMKFYELIIKNERLF